MNLKKLFISFDELHVHFIPIDVSTETDSIESGLKYLRTIFTRNFIIDFINCKHAEKIILLPNIFPARYDLERFNFKNGFLHVLITDEMCRLIGQLLGYNKSHNGIFAFEARFDDNVKNISESSVNLNIFLKSFNNSYGRYLEVASGTGKLMIIYLLTCLLHG